MSNLIRKISIGADYKNDAMHYQLVSKCMEDMLLVIYLFDRQR